MDTSIRKMFRRMMQSPTGGIVVTAVILQPHCLCSQAGSTTLPGSATALRAAQNCVAGLMV
jgi:hypothetical protein